MSFMKKVLKDLDEKVEKAFDSQLDHLTRDVNYRIRNHPVLKVVPFDERNQYEMKLKDALRDELLEKHQDLARDYLAGSLVTSVINGIYGANDFA